jgi:hypothetical protein
LKLFLQGFKLVTKKLKFQIIRYQK